MIYSEPTTTIYLAPFCIQQALNLIVSVELINSMERTNIHLTSQYLDY